jgi:hypothetical protein
MDYRIGELLDLAQELKIRVESLKADLKDCRNELCLRCGEYKTAHLGSCDGCRWKERGNG